MAKVTRMFPPEVAEKLALQTPTSPTGIIFEWPAKNGLKFDLMPLTYQEFLDLIPLVGKLVVAYNALTSGTTADAGDVFTAMLTEVPEIIVKVKDHLAKSPGVVPVDHPEDREVFDAWFMAQDAIGMTRAFLPKMKEALVNLPLGSETESKPTLKSVETPPTASTQ